MDISLSPEVIIVLMFSCLMLLMATGQRVFGVMGFVGVAAAMWLWGGDGGATDMGLDLRDVVGRPERALDRVEMRQRGRRTAHAVLGNEVQLMFSPVVLVMPHVASGRLVPLAFTQLLIADLAQKLRRPAEPAPEAAQGAEASV